MLKFSGLASSIVPAIFMLSCGDITQPGFMTSENSPLFSENRLALTASVCPAAPKSSQETAVFDDEFHEGWQGTSWGGPQTSISDSPACSGRKVFAMAPVSQKYTGMVLYTNQPLAATAVRALVYVDQPSVFSFGIGFEGEKPGTHTFLQAPDGGEVFRSLHPGWQLLEGRVPAQSEGQRVGRLTRIMFEMQNDQRLEIFAVDEIRIQRP